MMQGKTASLIAAGLFVAACAHPRGVGAETAISLADKACDESWGADARRQGSEWHVNREDWRARVIGDHWKVWVGDEEKPALSVNIPRDGRVPDSDSCELLFQD
jgi:hypothetical protein